MPVGDFFHQRHVGIDQHLVGDAGIVAQQVESLVFGHSEYISVDITVTLPYFGLYPKLGENILCDVFSIILGFYKLSEERLYRGIVAFEDNLKFPLHYNVALNNSVSAIKNVRPPLQIYTFFK